MRIRFVYRGLPWLLILLCTACKKIHVYEKHASFPGFKWKQEVKPVFEFEISDSSSAYNIMLVCRHTDAYAYSNLWVRVTEQQPGDSARATDIQMPLTVNNKEWAGTGMDDIFEVRILPVQLKARSLKKGTCKFTVEQIMRDNPLQEVMNFGIRIEKISQ